MVRIPNLFKEQPGAWMGESHYVFIIMFLTKISLDALWKVDGRGGDLEIQDSESEKSGGKGWI